MRPMFLTDCLMGTYALPIVNEVGQLLWMYFAIFMKSGMNTSCL